MKILLFLVVVFVLLWLLRGAKATRGVYAGAALLLLAYVGSRFVLEVVLHRPPSA